MSIITNHTDINIQQWQQLLSESPVASWFQSPETYRFFCSLPELMEPFIVAVIRNESSPQTLPRLADRESVANKETKQTLQTSPRLADCESVALNNRSFEQKRDKNKETQQT
jgi:hypothetical protein